MAPKFYAANYLLKDSVTNEKGENLGKIDELMIDLDTGRIMYAVLAFGGFPSRTKMYAVPWELLTFSTHDKKFLLNVPREVLANGPGYDSAEQVFEKADTYWLGEIYEYYSHKPEWEKKREDEKQADVQRLKDRREEIMSLYHKPQTEQAEAK